ncbi:MAG: SDR family NAD(P)-dependent oxidoreductase [Patescibacteria group bacterium]|nr:SDR family NAD(P)-dependent oxidoreductase [Patescibacteria group bacterium]
MSFNYAFVTGASQGLGKAFCEYLSVNGYFVFAGVRDIQRFDLAHENVCPVVIDVTSDSSISQACEKVREKTNAIDLLINNAGINKDTATFGNKNLVCKLDQLDRGMLLKMFNTNSVSPLMVTKCFLPFLVTDPCFVINISSNRASFHDELPNENANYGYRASKIALNMYTFCSVWDLPKNVKTFAVHPGDMKTHMNPDGVDDPLIQAEKIINITKNWNDEFNGKFLRYSGELYPL